jgi:hypothetical protein
MDDTRVRLAARYRQADKQRLAAKSKGPDIRAKLNNARIHLNNIQSQYGRGNKKPDFAAAVKDFAEALDEITSVLFAIPDAAAKDHLTRAVISEINQGIDAAKAADSAGIEISAGRAVSFLEGAIEYLNKNPDHDEKKERLAGLLASILPYSERDGTSDYSYEQAVKLCKEIAETEKTKAKGWFTDLAGALDKVNDAKKDLRAAASFAYKMLPKDR